MQRLFMLFLVCLSVLAPVTAQAWWQPDWNYRKQISIDTTPTGGAFTERVGRVPMLIRLHTGNFTFDGTQDNGADIRFVAADDKTVLNYQIESFDPLMGVAYVWVDLPAVEAGQRQNIWMYYGNSKAPSTANGQLTFDPDYTLVYHFDNEAGAAPRDTTAYANNAQTPVTGVTDGVVGRAAQFNGGAPLLLPANPSLAVPASGPFTFSAWVRADQPTGEQLIYARRDSGNSLLIGLNQGVPFVEVNGQRSAPAQPLSPGQWQHVAVTANANQIVLYINGHQASTLAAALPALSTVAAIGGDIPGYTAAPAAPATPSTTGTTGAADNGAATAAPATTPSAAPGTAPSTAAAAAPAAGTSLFIGAIDEVRLSKVARPAALLLADAMAQGAESPLVVYGADEKQSGFGFGGLGFLLHAVPADAWVIIAVLLAMMIQSWVIMIHKNRSVTRIEKGDKAFRTEFAKVGTRLEILADDITLISRLQHSSLWHLYQVAVRELRLRRSEHGAIPLSDSTIEAIRAAMDTVRTEENRHLSHRLGILSNAIAGGPYIGLLGTVLGIMVVFLGTAMAGDVNINAVAPGMAAALLATAMGLFVAIPALFGYNRLIARNRNVSADMRVFLDEFVTRLAELHDIGAPGLAAEESPAVVKPALSNPA